MVLGFALVLLGSFFATSHRKAAVAALADTPAVGEKMP
jgi:hypothetical protein